jgi:tripartite-type tricarboxylate transporter receptor subunit TctC
MSSLLRSPGRRFALGALAAGAVLLASGPSLSQAQPAWKPTKPIRFIVGFSAGGSADALARLLAVPMGQKLGTPVVVENIPGAGANIAMATVARATPDGYTIGMGSPGPLAINPALMGAKMPFKGPQDFTPITLLVTQPNVLIVNSNLGVNNMTEFTAWVKAHPDAAFGSAGIGTSNHLTGELLGLRLNAKLTHIAYKGASQVITDLIAGHIPMTIDNITTAAPMVQAGRVKGIAVTTEKRSPMLPNVPTLAESGLPGFNLASWQGLLAPRGLPPAEKQALYDAAVFALQNPEVRHKLAEFGSEAGGESPEAFAVYLQQEAKRWGDIVRAAKVTIE